jgi:hypothetical protein
MEMRNAHKILVGKPEGKNPARRPKRRRRIIFKYALRKYGVFVKDSADSGKEPATDSCIHGNEPSGYTKRRGIS